MAHLRRQCARWRQVRGPPHRYGVLGAEPTFEGTGDPTGAEGALVEELLGRDVGLPQHGHDVLQLAAAGFEPEVARVFDEMVAYVRENPNLGLPCDEIELANLLANHPVTIDIEGLEKEVDQELAAEYEQAIEQAKWELGESAEPDSFQ